MLGGGKQSFNSEHRRLSIFAFEYFRACMATGQGRFAFNDDPKNLRAPVLQWLSLPGMALFFNPDGSKYPDAVKEQECSEYG